jgi:hypothetical protein
MPSYTSTVRLHQLNIPELSGYISEFLTHSTDSGTSGLFSIIGSGRTSVTDSGGLIVIGSDTYNLTTSGDLTNLFNSIITTSNTSYYPYLSGNFLSSEIDALNNFTGNLTGESGMFSFIGNSGILISTNLDDIIISYTGNDWQNYVPLSQFNSGTSTGFNFFYLKDNLKLLSSTFNQGQDFYLQGQESVNISTPYIIDLYGSLATSNSLPSGKPYILGFDVYGGKITSSGNQVLTFADTGYFVSPSQLLSASGSLMSAILRYRGAIETGIFSISGISGIRVSSIGSNIIISSTVMSSYLPDITDVSGCVGLNILNPNYTLDVGGDINLTGNILHNGNIILSVNDGLVSFSLGKISSAAGYYSIALGDYSSAAGYFSTALGDYSSAEGYFSIALGDYSSAAGMYSIALGDYSSAAGYFSTALGGYSQAAGTHSTALGDNSSAAGYFSIALGYNSLANAGNSISLGNNARALSPNSIALGMDSTASSSNTFIIGCTGTPLNVGVNNSSPVYTLDVNGNGNFSSGVYISGNNISSYFYSTNNPSGYITGLNTGSFITTDQSGLFYPKTNPSGYITGINLTSYITTGQTGQFYSINNPSGYITGVNTGNFITTGQTGLFYATSNPSNYITISSLSPYYLNSNPSGFITGFNSGIYALNSNTGNFVTTGQTGIFYLNSNPSGFISSESLFTANSGSYYPRSNPSGYITGVNTGNFVTTNNTGLFITTGQTGAFYPASNPSGYITGVNLTSYVTTGQTGVFYPTSNPSGYISSESLFTANSGSYYPRSNPSGYITGLSYYITTGQTGAFYPTSNPSGFISSESSFTANSGSYYPRSNPSGYITGVNLTSYVTTTDSRQLTFSGPIGIATGSPVNSLDINGTIHIKGRDLTSPNTGPALYYFDTQSLFVQVGGESGYQFNNYANNVVLAGLTNNGSFSCNSGIFSAGASANGSPVITSSQTGVFYPTSNPSGYISSESSFTANSGSYYPRSNPSGYITGLSYYITTGQTGAFYSSSNPSGYITGLNTGNFVTTTDSRQLAFSGYVGVGVASPVSPLDVNGAIHIGGYGGSNTGPSLYNFTPQDSFIMSAGSGGFQFNDQNNTLAMVNISSTGTVGIGTQSPTQRLDVRGNITGAGLALGNRAWKFITQTSPSTQWNADPYAIEDRAILLLTGNTILSIGGLYNGWAGALEVSQNGVSVGGPFTLTLPTNTKVVNNGLGVVNLTSGNGAIDILGFSYDGYSLHVTYGNNFT